MLNLSRNLGLVTGASVMGTVYAVAGMHATFAVATALVVAGIALAGVSPRPGGRHRGEPSPA